MIDIEPHLQRRTFAKKDADARAKSSLAFGTHHRAHSGHRYALAFWCYSIGLKQLPASMAGLFLNLIPIFGLGGAYLFLGERLTLVQWIGGTLILLAVIVALRWQDATARSAIVASL